MRLCHLTEFKMLCTKGTKEEEESNEANTDSSCEGYSEVNSQELLKCLYVIDVFTKTLDFVFNVQSY